MAIFSKSYNYEIASLVEYSLDTEAKGLNAPELLESLLASINKPDAQKLRLLFLRFDIENIVALANNRTKTSVLSTYSIDELRASVEFYLSSQKNSDTDFQVELPPFIERVLASYKDPKRAEEEEILTSISLEQNLWSAYYRFAEKSDSHFICEWLNFDRSLRNITSAATARRLGMDVSGALVGSDDITSILETSNSSDFGLKGMFDNIDETLSILELDDMVAKERKLDTMRWDKIDDLTTFDYFTVDALLGYMAKIAIIYRWIELDRATGEAMFNRLLADLTKTDKIAQA